jgi:hypothetical protein
MYDPPYEIWPSFIIEIFTEYVDFWTPTDADFEVYYEDLGWPEFVQ